MDNAHSFEKLKELDAYFDEQLRMTQKSAGRNVKDTETGSKKWLIRLGVLFVMLILPFLVLTRSSNYLYGYYGFNGWLALGGGVAATVLLLLAYVWAVNYRYLRKQVNSRFLIKAISALVMAYCCYGLLYLSGVNAKNQEVRSYYRSLHPILRVTLATTTLADQQLVITDTKRVPDDYLTMGLPVNGQSLHYLQDSGYVHAVDIRTAGRAEWKNWLTKSMFQLAGLQVMRHAGTADHLHVYLPLNE